MPIGQVPIASRSFEAKISIDIQQTWYFLWLYVFLKRHFKQNVKSHWNLKNIKYIFSNTAPGRNRWPGYPWPGARFYLLARIPNLPVAATDCLSSESTATAAAATPAGVLGLLMISTCEQIRSDNTWHAGHVTCRQSKIYLRRPL